MDVGEAIRFLEGYPAWVKVTVPLLVAVIVIILVLSRPSDKTSGEATVTETVQEVGVGAEIALDLSMGQSSWNGLTSWAERFSYPVYRTTLPFSVQAFVDSAPGVRVFPLPKDQLITDGEAAAIRSWVERGGGLLVLGYYAADTHHGSNPSRLLREWGVSFREDLLMPPNGSATDTRRHVFNTDERFGVSAEVTEPARAAAGGAATLLLLSSATINIEHLSERPEFVVSATDTAVRWVPTGPIAADGMRPIIEEWRPGPSGVDLVVCVGFTAGRGRVVVVGTWKLAVLEYAENARFVAGVVNWLRPSR